MADDPHQLTFSQRMGLTPVRAALQVDSMDDALRNGLWNVLLATVFIRIGGNDEVKEYGVGIVLIRIWKDHLKRTRDSMEPYCYQVVAKVREHFFSCPWNKVYDLIDFIARIPEMSSRTDYCKECNFILERENAGYRFIVKTLSSVTSESEIKSIEEAASYLDLFGPASAHISTALKHLSDRTSPDYRNSIKESISAVEAACQIITGDPKATLGQAVKKLESSGVNLHPAFKGALDKMYGYTNDAEGIRHALLDESTLDSDDARFMLVSCSAFVNYLKAKSNSAS